MALFLIGCACLVVGSVGLWPDEVAKAVRLPGTSTQRRSFGLPVLVVGIAILVYLINRR
jgi:hypothetical protein